MTTKLDTRKTFVYHGVSVVPERGPARYFGCGHGHYLTRWWRVGLSCVRWVLVGTKADARKTINDYYSE